MKIIIPGVGEVEVEGAAQESTMQSILKVLNKIDKNTLSNTKKTTSSTKDLDKLLSDANKGLTDLDKSVGDAGKGLINFGKSAGDVGKGLKDLDKSADNVSGGLINFGKSLGSTAAAVAVGMMKNFNAAAADPIGAGATLINTGIDLLSSGLKIGVDAVSAFSSGLLGAVPIVGGGLQRAADGLANVAKETIDLVASTAKMANDFMSGEFHKTADAMKQFTSAGASFSGGMTAMRTEANKSGLGITSFANTVAGAQEALHQVGITGTESAALLSKGLSALVKTTKTVNGVTLTTRDQLLNLGVAYEDQGAVMALYMQQQKIAGKNLDDIASADLAEQTLEYAKNLKIISDFTGKDAKVIAEKAQADTLRQSIIQSMNVEQQKSFAAANEAASVLGPSMQLAIAQFQKFHSVMDTSINTNVDLMDGVRKLSAGIDSGTLDIASASKIVVEAAKMSTQTSQKGGPTGAAIAAGLAGVNNSLYSGMAETQMLAAKAGMMNVDAITQSAKAVTNQAVTIDSVSQGYAKAADAAQKLQQNMETLATQLLPDYSKMIAATTDAMSKAIIAAVNVAKNPTQAIKDAADAAAAAAAANKNSKTPSWQRNALEYGGTAVGTLVGGGVGGAIGHDVGSWTASKLGYAKGGISNGPLSGYQEMLHGTEAIVPLPDGKSIPVKLDSSSLTNAINQQTGLLQELLSAIHRGNTIQDKMLQNSY